MVESAQPGHRNHNGPLGRLVLDQVPIRCVLFQRIVDAVLVVVVDVVADQPAKMLLVQRDDMVEDLAATTAPHRSAVPFCQGAWTLVRWGFSPVAFKNAVTSALKIESRSRMA